MSHYIPPLLSATTFFFSAGGSEHARGPLGVCAEWYMRFFLRTVVTVLLLPKSWKKGNSKLQSEASWTVRRGVVTQRYADVSCKVTEKGRELWEKEVRKNSTVKKNLNTDNFNCWRHSDLIFGLYFFSPTKRILPFISAPWRNAVTVLRWKGADLVVLWCSH